MGIGPVYIRSSCVNAQFFGRGIGLGYSREALVAAQTNLTDWLRIVSPIIFGRIFNSHRFAPAGSSKAHGSIYYIAAAMIAFGQLLFIPVDKRKLEHKPPAPPVASSK